MFIQQILTNILLPPEAALDNCSHVLLNTNVPAAARGGRLPPNLNPTPTPTSSAGDSADVLNYFHQQTIFLQLFVPLKVRKFTK